MKEVIDDEFESLTEQEEEGRKERLKSKWAALEAVVGDPKRVRLIADDIVRHFETRQETMHGKAMIVCMSRRICVELYEALRTLRPAWHDPDDLKGQMKLVMTGSASDPESWQEHIRAKGKLLKLAERFKDPSDPLRVVIVRDMWLTGFDAPCLHTLYVDKPMQGHGLMQAIARVNRVFPGKPGGLVVDYLGLAENLRRAMATYTASHGQGEATIDQGQAVAAMLEKIEVCRDLFHGFDYAKFLHGTPLERLQLLPAAQDHVLRLENGTTRLVEAANQLAGAFALSLPRPEAVALRDEIAFFLAVKAALVKLTTTGSGRSEVEIEQAIRQIVSRAISTDGIVDVFAMAGLRKPEISILSEDFLAEVRGLPHKNLAAELLRKLLEDELRARRRTNVVQSEALSEKLERTIARYRNRAIETVQVIEELIGIAREVKAAQARGPQLGLSEAELAFYDVLETNDSAVAVLGDAVLTQIARELTETIRSSVTIDWTMKETVKARLRTLADAQEVRLPARQAGQGGRYGDETGGAMGRQRRRGGIAA